MKWTSLAPLLRPGQSITCRVEARPGARKIEVDLPPDLPLLTLDAMLIEQLLTNLIENSLKYAPADAAIRIAARTEVDAISVTVADTGPGFPPGDLARVFDKFYRGQREGTVVGAGLGLTICSAIARAHGGGIAARNRSDGGAEVLVRLPRGETPPVIEPEPP